MNDSQKYATLAGCMKIRLLTIILFAFASFSCSKYSKVLKSKDYEYKLKMAEQYYAKKKFRQAQTLFEELFPIYKGSPQFEDLYYKYAYCHYYLRDFANAENLFKGFLEVFANSTRAEEVEYMQGYCYYKQSPKPALDQSNTVRAMGMMQVFINTHPGSSRNTEAEEIIAKCYEKLEQKELTSAQLYFDLGHFRAAALAFGTLINNYPESSKADEYKLMAIRAYYKYASMSIEEKQQERFEKVVTEVQDFQDRFPESKLLKEAERFLSSSQGFIKKEKETSK
jgi:outer membrane protein assembly factor BamD